MPTNPARPRGDHRSASTRDLVEDADWVERQPWLPEEDVEPDQDGSRRKPRKDVVCRLGQIVRELAAHVNRGQIQEVCERIESLGHVCVVTHNERNATGVCSQLSDQPLTGVRPSRLAVLGFEQSRSPYLRRYCEGASHG